MELLTRDDGVRYLDSLFETIKRDYDIRDLEYMIGEVVDAAERRVITNQSMKFFLRLIEVRPNIKICFDTPQKADELLRLKAKGAYQGVIILQRDINSTNATPEQVIRRYPRLKLCDGYIPTVETMNYTASPDVNCTPFVRQYGILLGNGVFCYAKRSTKQTIYAGIQKTGD